MTKFLTSAGANNFFEVTGFKYIKSYRIFNLAEER